MFKEIVAWAKDAEPVRVTSAVVAVVGGVIAPAVADLPASASWTAVASAAAFALVRRFVFSKRTVDEADIVDGSYEDFVRVLNR